MRASLFLHAAGVEARKRMAYRADFWIQSLVVFLAELGAAWFVWAWVFEASGSAAIGGLSRDATVLYYVAAVLCAKLVRGGELGETVVSQDVYEGRLTPYLLYPAPYPVLKYAQHVGSLLPAALQFGLFGAAFPFLLAPADAAVTPASLAMGAVSVAAASLLYYAMSGPIQCVAFWADNVWSLAVAQRLVCNLLGGLMVPLAVFPSWAAGAIEALPFRHLYSEPVLVLLSRRDPLAWLSGVGAALAWTAAFAALGAVLFRRGRLRYTGVGI